MPYVFVVWRYIPEVELVGGFSSEELAERWVENNKHKMDDEFYIDAIPLDDCREYRRPDRG